jgi:hypothetical protein
LEAKSKKLPTKAKGKHHSFSFSTDFPDLKAIDNLISLGLEHRQIPIHDLQRVAMEVYGISSSEVEPDKLLQTHGLRPEDADASKKLVIYGSNI